MATTPGRYEAQEIVDEIRAALNRNGDSAETDLIRLEKTYSDYARQLNVVLKNCEQLIQKGLRGEAVQRADEIELLDLVTILDFPECDVFADFLGEYRVPLTARIDTFAAEELNSCYEPIQRLEPYMRQLRRQALSYSPLRLRIETLRKIQSIDQTNEVWTTDLRTFEAE